MGLIDSCLRKTLLAALGAAGPVVSQALAQDDLPPAPGDPDAGVSDQVRSSLMGLDPARVGWESEADERAVVDRLALLLDAWRGGPERVAPDDLLAAEFVSPRLRPDLDTVVRGAWRVSRPVAGSLPGGGPGAEPGAEPGAGPELASGPGALLDGLASLDEPFAGLGPLATKAKVVGLELGTGVLTTNVRIEAHARGADAAVQLVAHWRMRWSRGADGLRLTRIDVTSHEEVRAPGPLFRDASSSVLGSRVYERQFLPGLAHWRARLDAALGVGFLGHHGLALGDVDGDGLEDVYVCQPGGLPNRLFLRGAGGGTSDGGADAGVDYQDSTSSALLVDLDGDGDLDLALAMGNDLVVLENERGRFKERAALPGPGTTSMAASDVDLDGDVDLFACGYVSPYDGSGTPLPYHDANNGQRNTLYRNDGEFVFADATDESGLGTHERFSFAAAFEDVDDDGDDDLYVANDFGRNELYLNEGGKFTDVSKGFGVEDLSAGMGVSFGDYDRDGRVDLHVSNMFSSAGGRIAYQRNFRTRGGAEDLAGFRRHAAGNTLFRGTGEGFEDTTAHAGVAMGRWAWGALLRDFDGDGWDDLLVPNGFVTERRADDL